MNESSICRLKDGRIMCIARPHYATCFSEDDGKTWTKPVRPKGIHGGVEPCLQVLPNGVVVLSAGRPGLRLHFNADGKGLSWQTIDILEHHNTFNKDMPLVRHSTSGKSYGWGTPTGYTEVIVLDPAALLMVYDRPADTWPAKSTATKQRDMDTVWVVQIRLTAK
jgi:hypothetical protein